MENDSTLAQDPCRRLWQSVIGRAMMDIKESSVDARSAIDWILGPGTAFDEVCELAGVGANYYRERTRRFLKKNPLIMEEITRNEKIRADQYKKKVDEIKRRKELYEEAQRVKKLLNKH